LGNAGAGRVLQRSRRGKLKKKDGTASRVILPGGKEERHDVGVEKSFEKKGGKKPPLFLRWRKDR